MVDSKFLADVEKIKSWLGTGSINIFAPPWGGKDTNANRLADLVNGSVIGGGHIIRNRPELAQLKNKTSDGSLAPQDEYLAAVTPYFSSEQFVGKPLILSSVGRWKGEETVIQKAAQNSGHPIRAVIYIQVSESEVRRRLKAAEALQDRTEREDDDESKLEKRLSLFDAKTLPVIDYYRRQGLVIEINGENNRQAVLAEIVSKLANFTTSAA